MMVQVNVPEVSPSEITVAILKWFEPIVLQHSNNPPEYDKLLRNRPVFGKQGIYVFAERKAGVLVPRYIGLASRTLKQRLKSHFRSAWLDAWLKKARSGSRVLLVSEMFDNPNYSVRRMIGAAERALILKASDLGYNLLNRHQRGTKAFRPFDDIPFKKCIVLNVGVYEACEWLPSTLIGDVNPPRRPRGS